MSASCCQYLPPGHLVNASITCVGQGWLKPRKVITQMKSYNEDAKQFCKKGHQSVRSAQWILRWEDCMEKIRFECRVEASNQMPDTAYYVYLWQSWWDVADISVDEAHLQQNINISGNYQPVIRILKKLYKICTVTLFRQ